MIAPSQEGIILYLIWGFFVCFIIYFGCQYYIKAIKPWLMIAGCNTVQYERILLKRVRDNLIRNRVYNIKTNSYWVPLDDIYKEFEAELETLVREKNMTLSDLTLNQKLIKIFQDILDNRCFEMNYAEIEEILTKLRNRQNKRIEIIGDSTRVIFKKQRKKPSRYIRG